MKKTNFLSIAFVAMMAMSCVQDAEVITEEVAVEETVTEDTTEDAVEEVVTDSIILEEVPTEVTK